MGAEYFSGTPVSGGEPRAPPGRSALGHVSTVDLLAHLADRFDRIRVMIVVTYRPEELRLAKHPFLKVRSDLMARGACREITLPFLSHRISPRHGNSRRGRCSRVVPVSSRQISCLGSIRAQRAEKEEIHEREWNLQQSTRTGAQVHADTATPSDQQDSRRNTGKALCGAPRLDGELYFGRQSDQSEIEELSGI